MSSSQPLSPTLIDRSFQLERSRAMRVVLTIVLVLAVVLTFLTYLLKYSPTYISLGGFSLICMIAIVVNQKGRYRPAAILLSLGLLGIIQFNTYVGEGIHDISVLALPGVIAIAGLLYGTRSIPIFTGLTVLSLGIMAFVPNMHPIYGQEFQDMLIGTTLLAGIGSLFHYTIRTLENHIEHVQHSKQEVVASYEATLEGWAKALELRDKETEDHSRKVIALTLQLASALGIKNEEDLTHLRHGALLHDIGKIAISDSILLKPGPLAQEEWAVMRQHTVYALSFINHIPYLQKAVDVVLYHHEQWDGNGYPDGLKGEDIPLGARIFSIADNWSALCSDRPYRKAWPKDQVIKYIQENAGTKFDPKVVNVFIQLIEKESWIQ
jgi:putative nucleotidyltransferase with HDIG domain